MNLAPCCHCGFKFNASFYQCPSCTLWQTQDRIVEGAVQPIKGLEADGTILLSDAPSEDYVRLDIGALNPVFGGGLVQSSVTLLGGEPGAGKSTIAFQIGDIIADIPRPGHEDSILYLAQEQGLQDLGPLARRLGIRNVKKFRMIPIGSTANLVDVTKKRRPKAIFVDSLQAFADDYEGQVSICKVIVELCKLIDIPAIIVSQVTKAEDFAGLNKLKHAVDTLVMFTVYDNRREVRPTKNRFGPTTDKEAMFFDMTQKGLVLIANPFDEDGNLIEEQDDEDSEDCEEESDD